MPKLRSETYGSGDFSWLGSDHGIANGRTETLDISAFPRATYYPDGYIPSGTAVALIAVGGEDLLVPYDSAAATGAENLAGFVLTDQHVADVGVNGTEDLNVPVLDHGRIKTELLPGPDFVIPVAAKNKTTCVFVKGA